MTAGSLPPEVLTLRGPCPVRGALRVPGDKSVSHRALLLAFGSVWVANSRDSTVLRLTP